MSIGDRKDFGHPEPMTTRGLKRSGPVAPDPDSWWEIFKALGRPAYGLLIFVGGTLAAWRVWGGFDGAFLFWIFWDRTGGKS